MNDKFFFNIGFSQGFGVVLYELISARKPLKKQEFGTESMGLVALGYGWI